jgi:hypothetical protein
MTQVRMPMCAVCQHLKFTKDALRCTAFPQGIPADIIRSEFDLRKPHPNDRGIQFVMKPGKTYDFPNYEYPKGVA